MHIICEPIQNGDLETSSVQPRLTWQMVNELYAIHTNQDSEDIK